MLPKTYSIATHCDSFSLRASVAEMLQSFRAEWPARKILRITPTLVVLGCELLLSLTITHVAR